MNQAKVIYSVLIGTALGDSIGLPAEGLKPRDIECLRWNGCWKQRLLFGRGMWSDDTEHTIILAQALSHSRDDEELFLRLLAKGLRNWLLALPAGVGFATARALAKLWLGVPPTQSGVYSAGNGPAMRCALLGAYFPNDSEKRKRFNRLQTQLTHRDPKAEFASRAIVELSACFSRGESPSADKTIALLHFPDADSCWLDIVRKLSEKFKEGVSLVEFLEAIGGNTEKGISGYCYQTVPCVIYAGLLNDWHSVKTLSALCSAGGDTDTTAAIAGALCGAKNGVDSFPSEWADKLWEWPNSHLDFPALARAVADGSPLKTRRALRPLILIRNLIFLGVVLFHGFARARLFFLKP